MFRARGYVKSSSDVVLSVTWNMNIRKRWESQLYNMSVFDMSQDRTDAKTYYLYRSPMGVAHREFVMMQKVW